MHSDSNLLGHAWELIVILLGALWAFLNLRIGRSEARVEALDTTKLDKEHFDTAVRNLQHTLDTIDAKNDAAHLALHRRIDKLSEK